MNETDLYQSDETTLRSTSLITTDNNNTHTKASYRDSINAKKSLMDQLKTLLLNSLPHIAILLLFLLYSLIGAAIFFEIENDNLVIADRNIYASRTISKRALVTNQKKQDYKLFVNQLFKDHRIKVNQNMNKLISKYNQPQLSAQDNSSKAFENSIPLEGLEYVENLNLKNSNTKQMAIDKLGALLAKSNAEFQTNIKRALDDFYNDQQIFESKLADLFSKPEAHIDASASSGVDQQQQTCSDDTCHKAKRRQENKFLTSFHFIVASLFSIGHRNIVPNTVFGKLFTMIYLVIGLPLTLIFLSDVGKLMTRFLNFMYTLYIILCIDVYYDQILKFFDKQNWRMAAIIYRTLFSKIKKPKPQAHNQQLVAQYDTLARIYSVTKKKSTDLNNNNSNTIEHVDKKRDILQIVREIFSKSLQHSDNAFNFSFSFLALISFVYLTLGALFITRMTNQSILDGYYFGILTLTKIGSGDIYIQTNTQAVVCFLYVLFGMSFFSLTIKYLQEQIRMILLKNGQTIISEIVKFIDQFGYQLKTEDFNLTLSAETAKFATESNGADARNRMFHQRSINGEKISRKASVKTEVVKCDKQTQITTLLYSRLKYDGMEQSQSNQMTDMPPPPSNTTKKSNIEFCSTPTLTKQLNIK